MRNSIFRLSSTQSKIYVILQRQRQIMPVLYDQSRLWFIKLARKKVVHCATDNKVFSRISKVAKYQEGFRKFTTNLTFALKVKNLFIRISHL